jgi:hypothetical protein
MKVESACFCETLDVGASGNELNPAMKLTSSRFTIYFGLIREGAYLGFRCKTSASLDLILRLA